MKKEKGENETEEVITFRQNLESSFTSDMKIINEKFEKLSQKYKNSKNKKFHATCNDFLKRLRELNIENK